MPEQNPAISSLIERIRTRPEDQTTLDAVVEHARTSIDGCRWAGVTIRKGRGFTTLASTGGPVEAADRLQYEAGHGPCVDAVTDQDVFLVRDMRTETRWPDWTPGAVRLGVLSSLSIPMFTSDRTIGGLNLYGDEPDAFEPDDRDEAAEIAHSAAQLVAVTHEIAGLRTALKSRHTIGAAQGILRHRYGLTLEEAHLVLVRVSRDNNVKLAALAAEVVDANGIPARFGATDAG